MFHGRVMDLAGSVGILFSSRGVPLPGVPQL
jgi:hypothetical protein